MVCQPVAVKNRNSFFHTQKQRIGFQIVLMYEKGSHTAAGSLKEEKEKRLRFLFQKANPKQAKQKVQTIKLKNTNSKTDENQRRKATGAKPERVCQPVAV